MIKPGKKHGEWIRARKKLVEIYREKEITRCEYCGSTYIMSFHHINKRSSGKAEHTFDGTRLLCQSCHQLAEYNKDINEKVKEVRNNG